tara:strand:- start:429 stop:752 length:324 start_codon:yes stop_codon:yes gene_type:complete
VTQTVTTITKSDLIELLAADQLHLASKDIEFGVNRILSHMSDSLAKGERVEIRGFGSIGLRYRSPRRGRNPKSGESVNVPGKYSPHFKPGRLLRERVNRGRAVISKE